MLEELELNAAHQHGEEPDGSAVWPKVYGGYPRLNGKQTQLFGLLWLRIEMDLKTAAQEHKRAVTFEKGVC